MKKTKLATAPPQPHPRNPATPPHRHANRCAVRPPLTVAPPAKATPAPIVRFYVDPYIEPKSNDIKGLAKSARVDGLKGLQSLASFAVAAAFAQPRSLRYDLNPNGGVGWPVFFRNKYQCHPPKIFIYANRRLRALLTPSNPDASLALALNLALDALNTPPLARLPLGVTIVASALDRATTGLLERDAKVWSNYEAFHKASLKLIDCASHKPTKLAEAYKGFVRVLAKLEASYLCSP